MFALLLVPLAAGQLWRLRHDTMEGGELRWRQGRWTLHQGSQQWVIAPTRRSTVTPWVIYLAYGDVPTGSPGQLWLYTDSTCPEQLRRLRVRIALL